MNWKKVLTSRVSFIIAGVALVVIVAALRLRRNPPLPPATQTSTPAVTALPHMELQYELDDKIDSEMKGLRGITIDANDNVYLAGADAVKVLAADGKRQRTWNIAEAATGIDVDAAGNVYVAHRTKIEVFDNTGKLLRTWGKEGKNAGEFSFVCGVTVYEENLFVADAGNRCIHRFDTTGDFIDDIGKRDVERGVDGIVCPSAFLDVIVDKDGILIATNPGRSRVEQYKPDGTLVHFWGEVGAQPERFFGCCNPTNLALLPNGFLVTAEKILARVKVYDTEEKLLAYIGPEHFTKNAKGLDIAVDSRGRIFVIDPGNGQVSVFALKKQETENRERKAHGQ